MSLSCELIQSLFSWKLHFLLESMTDRHIVLIWAFGRHLLKNRRRKRACHFQENKWQSKSPVIKFELLWENETLGKLLFATKDVRDSNICIF